MKYIFQIYIADNQTKLIATKNKDFIQRLYDKKAPLLGTELDYPSKSLMKSLQTELKADKSKNPIDVLALAKWRK